MYRVKVIGKRQFAFFGPEGEQGVQGGEQGGEQGVTQTQGGQGGQATPPKSFNQEQVNRMLADERRNLKKGNDVLVEQLKTLKESSSLTQQERDDLQERIDQLQAQFQTKEEQAAIALKNVQTKAENDLKKANERGDSWKQKFDSTLVEREITAASVTHRAFNTDQVTAILAPLTKVVETLDTEGKPTGQFSPQVDFVGVDKDGKPVKLKLTVPEAVKAMTEMPEKYGNLFRAEGTSGTGFLSGGATGSGNKLPNLDQMTPEQYKKHREQIRQKMATERA